MDVSNVGLKFNSPAVSCCAATCTNPAGSQQVTCTISSTLPVGASFTYLLRATATTPGNYTNAVTVTATPDNNLGNNRGTSDVDVFEREEVPTPITGRPSQQLMILLLDVQRRNGTEWTWACCCCQVQARTAVQLP